MAYCVHCGVELEKGTPACPLCNTPVIDPAELGFPPPRPLYPEDKPAGIAKDTQFAKDTKEGQP